MASFAFTDPSIRSEKRKNADTSNVILRDIGVSGLILRKQRRDWVIALEKKSRGKLHRKTLGGYEGQPIADMRDWAMGMIGRIVRGELDPVPEDDTEAEQGRALRETFTEALDPYLANGAVRPKTAKIYQYGVGWFTDGSEVLMSRVTPAMVVERYKALVEEKCISTANSALASSRAVWNDWAVH